MTITDEQKAKLLDACVKAADADLRFLGNDAFEVEDNNYWLPDCCWEARQETSE